MAMTLFRDFCHVCNYLKFTLGLFNLIKNRCLTKRDESNHTAPRFRLILRLETR